MKILLFVIIPLLACLIYSCSRPSVEQRESFALINSYSKELAKTKSLFMIGKGGSFYDRIKILDIVCMYDEQLDLDSARRLIVPGVEGFIRKINNSAKLKSYLHHYPFSCQDVKFGIIFNYPEDGLTVNDKVASVNAKNGYIFYHYYDTQVQQLKLLHKETFEEALKIVTQENSFDS